MDKPKTKITKKKKRAPRSPTQNWEKHLEQFEEMLRNGEITHQYQYAKKLKIPHSVVSRNFSKIRKEREEVMVSVSKGMLLEGTPSVLKYLKGVIENEEETTTHRRGAAKDWLGFVFKANNVFNFVAGDQNNEGDKNNFALFAPEDKERLVDMLTKKPTEQVIEGSAVKLQEGS